MSEFALAQRYHVVSQTELTLPNIRSLTQVYLPIIGHEAFTLYMTLACYPHDKNRAFTHTELLDQAGLTHHSFLDARARLEGMGLLRTYRQDLTTGTQWVYEVLEPMSTRAFLADDTLASLLAHYLGEDTLQKLVADTIPVTPKIEGKNVTASFFDLVGMERFKRIKAPVEKTVLQPIEKQNSSEKKYLDIDLMANMLRSFNVSTRTMKENEAALLIEKELYGLDDVALVRLIQQNLSKDNTIDMAGIRRSLSKQTLETQRQDVSQVTPTTNGEVSEQPSQSKPKNATEQFLQQVKTLAPVTYLKALRQEKGGFVTDSELKTLQNIAQLNRLPNEVINVLLYELTVGQKRTSISRNLMQTIVNDWTQAGIKTAEGALKYLQTRQKNQSQQTGNNNRRYNNNRSLKNETRPDWKKQREQAAASSTEQAEAKRKLDAFLSAQKTKQED